MNLRSWWDTYSGITKIMLSVLVVAFLALFGYKFYSVVTEDLSIFVTPDDAFVNLPHGSGSNLSFSLQSNNFLLCEARCSASVKDLSAGSIYAEAYSVVLRNSNHTFHFNFSSPEKGEEKMFYSLSVSCSNIGSILCQREERNISAGGLIVINYTLTEEERDARELFLAEMRVFLQDLSEAELNVRKSGILLDSFRGDSFNGLAEEYDSQRRKLDLLMNQEKLLRIKYEDREYLDLDVPDVLGLSVESVQTLSRLREYIEVQHRMADVLLNVSNTERYNLIFWSLSNRSGLLKEAEANLEAFTFLMEDPYSDVLTKWEDLKWNRKHYRAVEDEALKTAREKVADILENMNVTRNLDNFSWDVAAEFCGDCNDTRLFPNLTVEKFLMQNLSIESNVDTSVEVPEKVCCGANDCGSCSPSGTPVLFLHGHSVNERNAPEFSLQAFAPLLGNLSEEGVLVDGGALTPFSSRSSIPQGSWVGAGRVGALGTYYFDSYLKGDSYVLSVGKSENIDTYAIRLKSLVDTLKLRTGSDKVVIVAHSMGGLVARRYTQVFGSESVEKLVMIGTPNHGVGERIESVCPVLGADRECEDMARGSPFLSNLNDPSLRSDVEKFIILGVGCATGGAPGDGVVRADSARLDGVPEVVVNGTCSGLDTFHTEMLHPEKYPDVYEEIVNQIG